MELKKVYLANLQVGSVMLHNLHWNVTGHAFKQVHEYLDVLYEEFGEMLDEVAERIRMDGEIAPASLKRFIELTDLEEYDDSTKPMREVIQKAHSLLKHMREQAADIRNKADEVNEFMWVALMEDQIAFYDKELWFMREMLAE
ncbi:MAG: DNA starvation/stationary phase protection protein [Tissierellia bacterium]|nr:DNA starvation/stationary phase protection protein [Tissierellia bacterium]